MNLIRVIRKGLRQIPLLWRRPDEFLRNVRQFTDPVGFRAQLLDFPEIRALRVEAGANRPPTLHVLLPVIARLAMTGGPNTVLNIGMHLAQCGLAIRFVCCDQPLEPETEWFWRHLRQLTGLEVDRDQVALHDGYSAPLDIGPNDLVLASFWTTAHQALPILDYTNHKQFLYLIQDFEPGFYPWSSRYALALETHGFPFRAIINESFLTDYLFGIAAGQFADASFRSRCATFEPAIDSRVFRPVSPDGVARRGRRLLVYARHTNPRNLLGIAIAALQAALADPVFSGDWEILAIGARGGLPQLELGGGHVLKEAPWLDYEGYGKLLQNSDILLCPMLSPHTSYPVLEMAACGGLSVTNSFASKTTERLAAISPNILAVAPTAAGFTSGLINAAKRVSAGVNREAPVHLPSTWDESLSGVKGMVTGMLADAAREHNDTHRL